MKLQKERICPDPNLGKFLRNEAKQLQRSKIQKILDKKTVKLQILHQRKAFFVVMLFLNGD